MTLGEILQKVGTDGLRNGFDQDVWIKSLLGNYNDKYDNWVITDCRFKNEAEQIKLLDGKIIRLNRLANINDGRIITHQSEIDLDDYDDFDYIINNIGSLQELNEEIINILDEI